MTKRNNRNDLIEVGDSVRVTGEEQSEGEGIYVVKAITDQHYVLKDDKGNESFHHTENVTLHFPLEVGKTYIFQGYNNPNIRIHTVTDVVDNRFRLDGNGQVDKKMREFIYILLIEGENLCL